MNQGMDQSGERVECKKRCKTALLHGGCLKEQPLPKSHAARGAEGVNVAILSDNNDNDVCFSSCKDDRNADNLLCGQSPHSSAKCNKKKQSL